MSTNGETADMVVRESIQITESAVKLAGLGAKNLAALLMAVAKDNPMTQIRPTVWVSRRTLPTATISASSMMQMMSQ